MLDNLKINLSSRVASWQQVQANRNAAFMNKRKMGNMGLQFESTVLLSFEVELHRYVLAFITQKVRTFIRKLDFLL